MHLCSFNKMFSDERYHYLSPQEREWKAMAEAAWDEYAEVERRREYAQAKAQREADNAAARERAAVAAAAAAPTATITETASVPAAVREMECVLRRIPRDGTTRLSILERGSAFGLLSADLEKRVRQCFVQDPKLAEYIYNVQKMYVRK